MRASGTSVETMANRFIDDPAIEFHPTALVGTRRRCDGHEGSGE